MLPTPGPDTTQRSEKARPSDKKRRYSPELKLQVVRETLAPGASVSIVARRHDINANLVFTWRKQFRKGGLVGVGDSGFIPVKVVDDRTALPGLPAPEKANGMASRLTAGLIEIVMPGGIVVRVYGHVDEKALRRVLTALS